MLVVLDFLGGNFCEWPADVNREKYPEGDRERDRYHIPERLDTGVAFEKVMVGGAPSLVFLF